MVTKMSLGFCNGMTRSLVVGYFEMEFLMRLLTFVALLILYSNMVFAQENKSSDRGAMKLPREFSLWYYPDSFNGRRGLRFDVFEITTLQDGTVAAKATMYGRGLDRCTISSTPIAGRIESNSLFLRLIVKDDDNLTCRTAYELKLGGDGVPEGGKYKREGVEGIGGIMKRE